MTGCWDVHELRCRAEEREQCVVIRPEGVLGRSTYAVLRDFMLKHAVDVPRALVVDLSDVTIAATSALSAFATVWLRICEWPAIPLLVVSGSRHADLLRRAPIRRYVAVFAELAEALKNVDQPAPRLRASRVLPHDVSSPGGARRFVRRTCAEWQLPELVRFDAVHVASELVQNTVQHTLSEARLRLELRMNLLTVAVGDDNPDPVVLVDPGADAFARGRGVHLVAQLARTWGCVTDEIGCRKTVWAVLGTSA